MQATRRGIWVSKIRSGGNGNAVSCAEHILHLTLSLLRDLAGMRASLHRRLLGQPLGQTLFGKRVVVVGLGDIALELLPRHPAAPHCRPDPSAQCCVVDGARDPRHCQVPGAAAQRNGRSGAGSCSWPYV